MNIIRLPYFTKNHTYHVAELQKYIDFPIKRVYFIHGSTKDTGKHFHKIEDEMFIVIQGKLTCIINEGYGLNTMELKRGEAIIVPHLVWHGFKELSKNAILLALSSTNYSPDRSDHIEDYAKFIQAHIN